MITREYARQYFKQCGLKYDDIYLGSLEYLRDYIDEEFCKLYELNSYWVRVNNEKRFNGKFLNRHIVYAFLTGTGAYFDNREVISFNRDGFIGFCGDADDMNTQPVLKAFLKWCDWLKGVREIQKKYKVEY